MGEMKKCSKYRYCYRLVQALCLLTFLLSCVLWMQERPGAAAFGIVAFLVMSLFYIGESVVNTVFAVKTHVGWKILWHGGCLILFLVLLVFFMVQMPKYLQALNDCKAAEKVYEQVIGSDEEEEKLFSYGKKKFALADSQMVVYGCNLCLAGLVLLSSTGRESLLIKEE
ncbi:MAG: hypothetical protein IJF71_01030 [Clostridia bacterium]|nr:hypothetical protein [Clostridia bacterium]